MFSLKAHTRQGLNLWYRSRSFSFWADASTVLLRVSLYAVALHSLPGPTYYYRGLVKLIHYLAICIICSIKIKESWNDNVVGFAAVHIPPIRYAQTWKDISLVICHWSDWLLAGWRELFFSSRFHRISDRAWLS